MFGMKDLLFACLIGSCALLASGQQASCIKEETPKIQSCFGNFLTLIQDLGSNGGQPDVSQITKLLCQGEGKTAITCILDSATRCPDLLKQSGDQTASQLASMGLNVTSITEQGGFDMYCAMMGGQGDCMKVQECASMTPQPDNNLMKDMQDLSKYMVNNATQFTEAKSYLFFQKQFGMVCGSMKPMLTCLVDALSKCPQMKAEMEKSMEGMSAALQGSVFGGLRMMSFEEQQVFLKSECNKIPKSFASDKCVEKQLMSADFATCHSAFNSKYPDVASKKECAAYDALNMCMKDAMEPCSLDAANAFARNTPVITDGLSNGCVQEISASNKLQVSLMTTVIAGSLLFFL